MIGRIVEVETEGCYLSVDRGFLCVSHKGEERGRVPLDDISGLILTAHGLSHSSNLFTALAERACPVVFCGPHHRPVGLLWAVDAHHREAARMDAQMRATLPTRKRLWRQVVQLKIGMQASVLAVFSGPEAALRRMAEQVKLGDASNVEGQAARVYWQALMGEAFRRNPNSEGVNSLLNYGYAIARAMVARHVMAAGLHPGMPLHHANEGNPMRLVDDLMEPFRPLVDVLVKQLVLRGYTEVTRESKRHLALLPTLSIRAQDGRTPVAVITERWCRSLAEVYLGQSRKLWFPSPTKSLVANIVKQGQGNAEEKEDD